ncbi:SDR family oxidoreductase [Microvirga sp. STS02]|uniref:SDR family NAD(P)-dependent oxidoreductase n=1 Tax=Hymenobacter negativus TaxID=2795026 RepID=UPI0018DC17A3|nr:MULTISPECIES: SDR family oxidoreductase [Bacteria]MBH8571010.1 SDR family oxidoreductase [Hymenobacter negativus]MBR7210748.1 SDR family oxidoreductase [Microvirga sp. STS02]
MSISKIALVTGGSRGLGKNMALNLAQKGLDVLLTYHSQQAEAESVVAEIQAQGRKAAALQLDASNVSSFAAFFEQVKKTLKETFGAEKFDFLINNAGTGLYQAFAETTEQQFDDILNIHFKGPFFLTQQALPLMNDGGGIVNISSGLTRIVMPGSSTYGSAKTAIESLTRYQAKELGARRIRVNVVAPGAIETDFGGGRTRDNKEINAHIASLTALGRVGLPTDVGPVVAFLCTDEAGWVNGQRLEVSGGQAI